MQDRLAEFRATSRIEAGIAAANRTRIPAAAGARPTLGTAMLTSRARPVAAVGTTALGRATALASLVLAATLRPTALGAATFGTTTLGRPPTTGRGALFGRAAALCAATGRRAAPAAFTAAHPRAATGATRPTRARTARTRAAARATARTAAAARTGSRASGAASTTAAGPATGAALGEGRRRARHDDRCGHRAAENPVHVPSHCRRGRALRTLDPGRNGDGIETVPAISTVGW